MMKNILMVDIETTGTKPGCKVLSIGAFGFANNYSQVEFYKRLDYKVMGAMGLTDDESTMQWWHKQSTEAFAESFGGTTDPAAAVVEFRKWFAENFSTEKGSGFSVWSCGIDFDFPILKALFEKFGTDLPWQFWTQNDYRTIKNMFPKIKVAEGNILKHTALEDAKAQMRGLRSFYKSIKGE